MSVASLGVPAVAAAGFAPYRAADSGATIGEVYAACNRDMHSGYGPVRRGAGVRPVAYPIGAYRQLISSLAGMERIECVTLGALCREPMKGGRVRLAIRHDVDGDIVAAERGAEIEAEFGVPSSYYFLHTAFYHGRFEGKRFLRHGCMGHVYRRIASLGHEVGLHTNGLEVYEEHGVDGAQAVAEEIAWMRSVGLDVRGTVGHGSKAVYGAENFEIFRGRAKGRARAGDALQDPERIEHNGKAAWVRVLDEGALGLEYEGNDIFWSERSRVEYGATRTIDGWRWNRRFEKDAAEPLNFCSQEAMLADIAALEPGCCVVLTIHPCYYGFRHRADAGPTLRLDRRAKVVNEQLGWRTWEPGSIVAVHEPSEDAREERQSFGVANDLGMLDADPGLSGERRGAKRRVLFLDGAALADPGIGPQSNAARIAAAALGGNDGSVSHLVLSHPGMGVARLYGWLEWALGQYKPTDVVLGVGSEELAWSMPTLWSERTGLSAIHPAGVCLVPGAGGEPEVRGVSPGWRVRQRKPSERATWPGCDMPIWRALAAGRLPAIDGVRAHEFVRGCISRVASTCRDSGVCVRLVLTDEGVAWRDAELGSAYRETVRSWARDVGVELIDPSEGLARLAESGVSVFRPSGRLSVDAHRVIGRAIASVLAGARPETT